MSGDYAAAEELTTVDPVGEGDVTLASGKKVRVRGMTRGEVFVMQKVYGSDEAAKERHIVSKCMLIPEMSEQQVGAWQREPANGNLDKVTEFIRELSKVKAGADKSGVSGIRADSESGVRVLPSGQAGDDGSRAPSDDEQ